MERLARQSPQATYAAATLKGKTEIGVLSKPFIDTIREDLRKYSIISENSFLVQFFKERESKDILYPTSEMETYTFEEVIENALMEFKLELWVPIRRTSVDWTQFSVAVLFLIAESSTYFCWTAELFRRADKKHRETDLMNYQQTYQNLFPYGRALENGSGTSRILPILMGVFNALRIFIMLTVPESNTLDTTLPVSLQSWSAACARTDLE